MTVNWYAHYDPSFPTAIVGAILFGTVGFVTLFQFFQKRCWFWWPLVLGTMSEFSSDYSNKNRLLGEVLDS